jgi:hypothetical protein
VGRRTAELGPRLVGTGDDRCAARLAEAVDLEPGVLGKLASEVLHVDAGAAVHLGRVLPGQERDAHHERIFSPLPMTTTPSSDIVNRARSAAGSTPIWQPSGICTCLSMIALRITA